MSYYGKDHVNISDFVGKTFIRIEGKVQDEEIKFYTEDGYIYTMYHDQDCCESVYVEDITGDFESIIGKEIIEAEEVSQVNPYASESGTWTFYKIKTNHWMSDSVVIRWNGESNGYYSESVDIAKEHIGLSVEELNLEIEEATAEFSKAEEAMLVANENLNQASATLKALIVQRDAMNKEKK